MAAPLETGQTETIASKVDYSKVSQLDQYSQVLVKQPVRAGELFMEMCCGCEMENLYTVIGVDEQSKSNEKLFTLKEDSNCCLRQCCGANRPLVLNATYPEQDDSDPLFVIDKPYRVGCCCCPATNCMGRNYMEVIIGGVMIGSVRETCGCDCRIEYAVYDENDTKLCTVERCACYCECMDVKFQIKNPDGDETGKVISKLDGGILKEMFTTNDNFLVEFPDFMQTTQRRLLLICAAMMIEFRHFENKPEKDDNDAHDD